VKVKVMQAKVMQVKVMPGKSPRSGAFAVAR
jgi:hypothetical protein